MTAIAERKDATANAWSGRTKTCGNGELRWEAGDDRGLIELETERKQRGTAQLDSSYLRGTTSAKLQARKLAVSLSIPLGGVKHRIG